MQLLLQQQQQHVLMPTCGTSLRYLCTAVNDVCHQQSSKPRPCLATLTASSPPLQTNKGALCCLLMMMGSVKWHWGFHWLAWRTCHSTLLCTHLLPLREYL